MASKDTMISMSVIRRLPRYYRFLRDLKENGIQRISSRELAKRMGLTASQIRQDLNCFGEFGQQGYGYQVDQLCEELHHILGLDQPTKAVLFGLGNLGHALVNHISFDTKGVELIGVFDDSPALIGQSVRGLTVVGTDELEAFCAAHRPELAILCIPKKAAPPLVDRLINTGVLSFWNFSHYDIGLQHPEVLVENVHLGDSLMTLSFRMGYGETRKG